MAGSVQPMHHDLEVQLPGDIHGGVETDDMPRTSPLLTLCWYLSASVLVNTFVYKAPQVYAIINSGSSAGVSLASVLLEWIAYTIMFTYHYAREYPLETYIEVIVMVIQDFVLTFTILWNRNMLHWRLIPYTILYTLGSLSIAFKLLPEAVMVLSIASTTLILCWSKLDQLLEILWTLDPGSLSALTWFIAVYDTGVRILTTIVITKDLAMLVNLTTSEVLNVAVWVSILYFNYKKHRRIKAVQLRR